MSNSVNSAIEDYKSAGKDSWERAYLAGWISGATAGEYDLPYTANAYQDWLDGLRDGKQYSKYCGNGVTPVEDRVTIPVIRAWQELS
jgi:ribosome modulation factor